MNKLAIMLDPGHGKSDNGACGNGLAEKDLNWKVACFARDILRQHGFNVNMTRSGDTLPGLDERCRIAQNWGADLFISIHHNAGGGIGYEVYHSVNTDIGKDFAALLAQQFRNIGQKPHGQGIYTKALDDGRDYYAVIRGCAARGIAAVITEYAYIDSADSAKIDNDDKLYAEAAAIAHAVCDLCGVAWEIAQPDEAKQIAQALAAKGWSSSPDYWAKAMRGEIQVNPEYLKALLKKAAGI